MNYRIKKKKDIIRVLFKLIKKQRYRFKRGNTRRLNHLKAGIMVLKKRQSKVVKSIIEHNNEDFNSCGNCLWMECDMGECWCHKHRKIQNNGESWCTRCPDQFVCDDWEMDD